jgi:hypothetical protein
MNWICRLITTCCFFLAVFDAPVARAQYSLHRTVDLRADLIASRLTPIGDAGGRPFPIALHYWADPTANRILRSDALGLNIEEIAVDPNAPYGLGFDADTQNFLWTSSGDETVRKLRSGAHEPVTLISSFEDPPAIELEREGGKQAITVVGNQVVRVTEDGISSEAVTEVLMSVDSSETIVGLALDAETGTLYVGNSVGMLSYKLRLSDNAVGRLTFTDHVPPTPDPEDAQ